MTAQKAAGREAVRPSTTTAAPSTNQSQRKPWVKKTPVQVVLDQINRLREERPGKRRRTQTGQASTRKTGTSPQGA